MLPLLALFQTSEGMRTRREVKAILAARAPPSKADELKAYVQRVELEDTLRSFLRQPLDDPGSYMVVFGPRGAGKSTLVSHVLNEMGEGTLVVEIDQASNNLESFVVEQALKEYRLSKFGYATSTPLENVKLARRLEAAANVRREKGWRPTLVLEVDRLGDSQLIQTVCRLLKKITHDRSLCHGLLVLSSSFAVAALPEDRGRQRFLRVGAFSRDEASAFLDVKFKAKLPQHVAASAVLHAVTERTLQLTTLPNDLGNFAAMVIGSESEQDFVARAEAWTSKFEGIARRDVKGADTPELNDLIRDKIGQERRSPMRDLMRELLDNGAPVELPTASFYLSSVTFASIIRTSLEAKAVFNVDLVSKTVDFASGAHCKAAAELLLPPHAGTPAS
jgi:hypothetical protein